MDTTVILAQPRVSQLRAAAVYVDRRAAPELGTSAVEIDSYEAGKKNGDPQKIAQIAPLFRPKYAKKVRNEHLYKREIFMVLEQKNLSLI